MIRCVCRSTLRALTIGCLLFAVQQPVSATIVFDDDFEGNSGGMPEGWEGEGTIIEEGTIVTLYAEAWMGSIGTVDPNAGTATIWVEVEGTDLKAMIGLLDSLDWSSHFFVKIRAEDGGIEVKASNPEQGEEGYVAGYVSGYGGGPVRLTVVLETTTFSISTDQPPFFTGPIEYGSVFTSFTRADLGSMSRLVTDIQLEGHPSAFASYDRVTMDVESSTPVQSNTFGRIKSLYGRRP